MKNIVNFFFIILVLTISISVYAEGEYYQVDMMINKDLNANYNMIKDKSKNLSDDQKQSLLIQHKKDPYLPIAINCLAGWGIGSFIQKDYIGAVFSITGNSIGLGLLWTGVIKLDQDSTTGSFTFVPFFISGLGVILITRIFDIIRPIIYSTEFNKKLEKAISIDKKTSVNYVPFMNIAKNSSNQYGLKATLSF